MTKISHAFPVAGLTLALCVPSAGAHHSFSMFDAKKTVTLNGTVRKFDWTNPHVFIDVIVSNAGRDERWSIETHAVTALSRHGWSQEMLKPGDKISAIIHPMRNGEKSGQLTSLTLPGGKVMDVTGAAVGVSGLPDEE